VVLVLTSVGAAFFRTQVLRKDDYRLRSDDNRLRVIPIEAPRGAVYDRNGEVIAETVPAYSLYLEPAPEDSAREALARLGPAVQVTEREVTALLGAMRRQPNQPALVAANLAFSQVAWVEEHRTDLPGILLEPRPLRRYPDGAAVAHLVGYVGEISEQELGDTTWARYRMGQTVGKSGIERQYESILGGERGERYVEVDASGRVIRAIAPRNEQPPIAGQDIHLSIDLELQRFAHQIFPEGMNGAIVAMVPSSGEVLALYSSPTYDPNLLVGMVSPEVWAGLTGDPRRPLVNRASSGIYPPGSTWKLATAIIGLEKEVITPQTRMPIPCTGGMSYAGRYSRCWKKEGHGSVDLAGAIANSCNVYFYQLGIRLGLSQLAREGTRLGFARPTGIDLPTESGGIFPTGVEWYARRFGSEPTPSEVMSLAIGQGPNSQTPLRMAQFFAALAGDGTAPPPRLIAGGAERLTDETDLRLNPSTLVAMREGLARVTEQGGTAYLASLEHWKLYGKTGTSENAQDPRRPHAWFTGFAGPRGGAPEIAVAVVVEFGRQGSSVAAPLGAKIADFYLNRTHGRTTDPERQTLAERIRAPRR
jgi:penicillin-binding protein 2